MVQSRGAFGALVLLSLTPACGPKSSHHCDTVPLALTSAGAGVQDAASTYGGLAFPVVDSGYSSSAVLLNDPAAGQLRQLDSGESGDPWLSWAGDRLFLFNRTATSLNFLTFTLHDAVPSKTCQIATPAAGLGDPHDAVLLDAHRMLLALNAAGQVVVIDPTTGVLLQTVEAAWDLGVAGAPLKPEKFYVRDTGNGTHQIYLLHQGLDAQNNPNGSQRVLVLADDGTTVTAPDPHGIPLKVSDPLGFYPAASPASVLIYGECTTLSQGACTQGFEELTFATGATKLAFDTGPLGLKGNGGLVKGAGSVFYALVLNATGKKVVEKLDVAAKTATDAYAFTGPSGCCELLFDDSSGTLYAGDSDPKAQNGFFAVAKAGAATATQVPLPGIPYGGVFIPR